MKRFVGSERWGPVMAGVTGAVLVLFANANEWMYAIIYPVALVGLLWPYWASRKKLREPTGGGCSKGSR